MIILAVAIIIFLVSFFWAIKSVKKELTVPEEVARIKIPRSKKWFGVVIFLKNRIVHYTSVSSSGS